MTNVDLICIWFYFNLYLLDSENVIVSQLIRKIITLNDEEVPKAATNYPNVSTDTDSDWEVSSITNKLSHACKSIN